MAEIKKKKHLYLKFITEHIIEMFLSVVLFHCTQLWYLDCESTSTNHQSWTKHFNGLLNISIENFCNLKIYLVSTNYCLITGGRKQ